MFVPSTAHPSPRSTRTQRTKLGLTERSNQVRFCVDYASYPLANRFPLDVPFDDRMTKIVDPVIVLSSCQVYGTELHPRTLFAVSADC